jgi:phenylpropionate dioxygenase-like ring-hydroxylating dioxygenase large terminal subunit
VRSVADRRPGGGVVLCRQAGPEALVSGPGASTAWGPAETVAVAAARGTTDEPAGEPPGRAARLGLASFWYVAAGAREVRPGAVLGRTVLGRPLALFRDAAGRAVALEDRCAHRATPLSAGRVEDGRLRCGYHGWLYDGAGALVEVPSCGPGAPARACTVPVLATCERDGYVYVRPGAEAGAPPPFPVPHHGAPGWRHVRLVSRFRAPLVRCVQNFVDVPHTAYVHAGLFRSPRRQRLAARVERRGASVVVRYRHETANLGLFARVLNPRGREIEHVDAFHAPNITCVEYGFGAGRFVITSQAVPMAADDTLVYTDLAFAYGAWGRLAAPLVRWLARRIIAQDVAILARQTEAVRALGERVTHAPADFVHALIEAIHDDLAAGRDPRAHPGLAREMDLWV